MNLNEKIGQRIQELRREQHITQAQLSEALDISIKHMSSVERGLSALSLERLIDVSYVLDCSLEYLILGSETRDTASRLPKYVIEVLGEANPNEEQLLTEYLHLYQKLRERK